MSAHAEFHVLAAKRSDFAVAKPGLNGDEQQGLVPPSDPCARIGSGHERCGLFVGQKFHRPAHKALGRDGQDTLTLQGQLRLLEDYELKEGM